MNSEAALTETWIVRMSNPGATIIRSSSCYESGSRYTKHYQQFWRYHNHISGQMPLTNSYLTTILVHMLWHSGELHILAPLALLLWLDSNPNSAWQILSYDAAFAFTIWMEEPIRASTYIIQQYRSKLNSCVHMAHVDRLKLGTIKSYMSF